MNYYRAAKRTTFLTSVFFLLAVFGTVPTGEPYSLHNLYIGVRLNIVGIAIFLIIFAAFFLFIELFVFIKNLKGGIRGIFSRFYTWSSGLRLLNLLKLGRRKSPELKELEIKIKAALEKGDLDEASRLAELAERIKKLGI